jgi:phytol kinase
MTLPLEIKLAAVAGWLAIVGIIAWGAHRQSLKREEKTTELPRKVVHIGTGNVILLAWWLQIPAWVAIAFSIVFSSLTLLSYYLPLLPGINSVGRKSWGTFFYAVSVGILVAWFWPLQFPQFAALGILVMTWGDGLAALIGQKWGRHPYVLWGIQKSWEGSFTMAIVSCLITGLVLLSLPLTVWQIALIATCTAIVATSLEAFSKLGIDNLTVPIASAACGFWLSQGWL